MGQGLYNWRYLILQPKFSTVYVIFTFISTIFGISVLVKNDNELLTRALGVMLFITFIVQFSKDYICHDLPQSDQERNASQRSHYTVNGMPADIKTYEFNSWPKYVGLTFAVMCSGFLRGLFGVGGPPMIIYFFITDIDKRIVRAIQSFACGFGSGIILIFDLLIIQKKFDASEWVTYLCMFISCLLGLLAGNSIHQYVDQKMFRSILLFLLLSGSINLMLFNLGEISMYGSAALMIIFIIMIVAIIMKICDCQSLAANAENDEVCLVMNDEIT